MLHMQTRPTQVVIHLDPEDLNRADLWLPEIIEVGDVGKFARFARNPGHTAPLRHSDPNREGAKWLLTKSSPGPCQGK